LNSIFVGYCKTQENELKLDPEIPTSSDGIAILATENIALADDANVKQPSGQQHEGYVHDGVEGKDSFPDEQIYHDQIKISPNEDPTIIIKDKDFYSFSAMGITGKTESLEVYRGKVMS